MARLVFLFCLLLAVSPAAADSQIYQYANITSDTTKTLTSAPGVLHTITFNNPVATGTVTIYDNTAASGTKIATITVPSSPMPVTLDLRRGVLDRADNRYGHGINGHYG